MGIESLSALLSDGLVAAGVNEMLRSLLVDGIVAVSYTHLDVYKRQVK